MTMIELLHEYVASTGMHSLPGPMRRSKSYTEIVAHGEAALPAILKFLKEHEGGMNIMLLLMDLVQDRPYTPKPVAEGMVGYAVDAAREAWLAWGRKRGYLEP